MPKKRETPKGKKIQMMCEFPLTDAEKAEKATIAATLAEEIELLETEKSESAKNFTTQINAKTDAVFRHLAEVKSGVRKEEAEVTEVKNFDRGVVEFWHDGVINSEREMTEDDRQSELDLRADKKKSRKLAAAPKESDNDIAQVHKEETNVRSKWSQTDGPRADA